MTETPDDRTALILYGSETGNSQDVAEELGRIAERLHFTARVREMDLVEIKILSQCTIVIFALSTTGQGEFPKNARKFWKSLLRKRLPPGCMSHVAFTTFGLGDSSYPRFNWSARKLHNRMVQLGAKEFYPRGEADEQHDEGIDGTFLAWSADLRKHLLASFPLPEGVDPLSPTAFLPPKFRLEFMTPAGGEGEPQPKDEAEHFPQPFPSPSVETSAALSHHPSSLIHNKHNSLHHSPQTKVKTSLDHLNASFPLPQPHILAVDQQLSSIPPTTSSSDIIMDSLPSRFDMTEGFDALLARDQLKEAHPEALHPLDQPQSLCPNILQANDWWIKLVDNKRLTPESHWQDVRELTFTMENAITLAPGDAVTIYPHNFPQDVQRLIDLMGWQDVADKHLKFQAERPNYFNDDDLLAMFPSKLRPRSPVTLRELLGQYLDITAIPRRRFFEMIANHTDDPVHKERLLEFANPFFTDEFYDYTSRPRRSILEILEDFPSVKLPFKWVASIFPLMQGRQYSISSGAHHLPNNNKNFISFTLLVAIVKYRTVLKKVRQGLCTRYLASLAMGSKIRCTFNEENSFYEYARENPACDIIFVCPGTGLAPCRSLIWERGGLRLTDTEVGNNFLFFGGRNKEADYFYKKDWEIQGLHTTVFTAFSRDQREKIYVQDILRQNGKLVFDALSNGTAMIYICGSSGNMPKAVREALLDIFTANLKSSDNPRRAAENFLKFLDKNKRYVQETW